MSDPLEPSGHPELLVAEPLVRTEIKIGYARLSTGGQKLEAFLDAGDALVVPSLDRYGRSL